MKIQKNNDDLYSSNVEIDIINLIENNRNRIRSLGNILMTACSILVTTSSLLLLYQIEKLDQRTSLCSIKLFILSDIFFICSIISSLLSVYGQKAKVYRNKTELITHLSLFYTKEQERSKISVTLLIIGSILLILGICVFSIQCIS